MCKLKFWSTATRIKLGVFFSAVMKARHAKSWSQIATAKKIKRPFDIRLENRKFFLLGCFFYVHVFYGMPFNEKQTAYWKSLNLIPLFFQLLELKQSQWRRQQLWHLTKGFPSTLAFIFFCTFIRFCMQNNKKSNNQKFNVLRRNTNN